MRAWDEDENDGPRGFGELYCRCGVVCSRAVKAAMREADRLADRAERNELAQISERLLENAAVRHFLLTFEEQDWPDLLPCIASIGIQALTMHYGRAAQLSLGSLRTLAKWIERYRVWPSSLEMISRSRSGSPASARTRPRSTGRVLPEGQGGETEASRDLRVEVPSTPPASCAILKPALTGIRARDQIRARSPPQNAQWSPRSSPRASPAGATLPWPSQAVAPAQNARCLQCETEHLPDSLFCRICGQHRDVQLAPASPLPPGWETRETQSLPSREAAAFPGTEMGLWPQSSHSLPQPQTLGSYDRLLPQVLPQPTQPVPAVSPPPAPVSPITPPTPPSAPNVSFGEVPPTLPVQAQATQVTPQLQPAPTVPVFEMPTSPAPMHPSPPLTLPQPVASNPSARWEPSRAPDAPRWRAREALQGAMSSRNERAAPVQDEWYQTLMSRLRRLGDQVSSPRERAGVPGEPVTAYASQNARPPMRSASREALNAKLRELGLERDGTPFRSEATPCQGGHGPAIPASMLLNDLPDRAVRKDSHSAAMAHPGREELLF